MHKMTTSLSILIIQLSSMAKGNDDIDISSDAIYITGGKGNDDINYFKKHTIYGGAETM